MDRKEIDLLDSSPNAAVVQLAGRSFPGVVIQGDSLHNLFSLVRDAAAQLREGDADECGATLSEVQDTLEGYLTVYQSVLDSKGIATPY